jgi:DNA-binding NtrC family response regulator
LLTFGPQVGGVESNLLMSTSPTCGLPILVVGGDAHYRTALRAALPSPVIENVDEDFQVLGRILEREHPVGVVFLSSRTRVPDLREAVGRLRQHQTGVQVILIQNANPDYVLVRSIGGAVDRCYQTPADPVELAKCILELLSTHVPAPSLISELLGDSPSMQRVKELIHKVAHSDTTILITGETGTGKELAARAIHRLSARADEAMVCVNCTAIPDTLLESELFGFEKGAFTGADSRQDGKLQTANRGTIFLDEIGDMSPFGQAKILRALESGEVQKLGGSSSVKVDVRILAATHHDLDALAASNRFRTDLLFRLNVVPVHLPPLRERPADIPMLIDHFVRQLNERYGCGIKGVTPAGVRLLCRQEWPGNIRQLRNVIEGAFVVCTSDWITTSDLERLHRTSACTPGLENRVQSVAMPYLPFQAEPDRLRNALQETQWNKSRAAHLLQWSRMTVYRKIAKYRLSRVQATGV